MQDYKPGERLRVTVDIDVINPGLAFLVGKTARGEKISFPADDENIIIERLVPAEGMPKPGELWETATGRRVLVIVGEDDCCPILFSNGFGLQTLADLFDEGPLTPIYREPEPTVDPEAAAFREQPAPEAAKDFPADDEPETVPIGGVAPGTDIKTPAWNDGQPVHVLAVDDIGNDHVRVRFECPHSECPTHVMVTFEERPVTIVEASR